MEPSTQVTEMPEAIHGLLKKATFVVSTWFCSILDPLCINLRRERPALGQDHLLPRPRSAAHAAGAFPDRRDRRDHPRHGRPLPERRLRPALHRPRGSDFRIGFTPEMRENQLATNRWRGKMTAEEDGCYVHYLPTHGPNLWDHNSVKNDISGRGAHVRRAVPAVGGRLSSGRSRKRSPCSLRATHQPGRRHRPKKP
jgi:hypothetical protein